MNNNHNPSLDYRRIDSISPYSIIRMKYRLTAQAGAQATFLYFVRPIGLVSQYLVEYRHKAHSSYKVCSKSSLHGIEDKTKAPISVRGLIQGRDSGSRRAGQDPIRAPIETVPNASSCRRLTVFVDCRQSRLVFAITTLQSV